MAGGCPPGQQWDPLKGKCRHPGNIGGSDPVFAPTDDPIPPPATTPIADPKHPCPEGEAWNYNKKKCIPAGNVPGYTPPPTPGAPDVTSHPEGDPIPAPPVPGAPPTRPPQGKCPAGFYENAGGCTPNQYWNPSNPVGVPLGSTPPPPGAPDYTPWNYWTPGTPENPNPLHAQPPGGTAPPPAPPAPADNKCPPGQSPHPTRGDCRYPGDYPCPPGQCKDSVSGVCRSPGGNEKVRESDATDVRGLCKQLDPGKNPNYDDYVNAPGQPGRNPSHVPGTGVPPPGTPGGTYGINLNAGAQALQTGGVTPPPTPTPPGAPPSPYDVSSTISTELDKIIKGDTRFSPEVMGWLEGGAKASQISEAQGGRAAVEADAIRRGVGRSGFINPEIGRVNRGAAANFSKAVTGIKLQKVHADFTDKVTGLQMSQKWLDSLRDYTAKIDATQADREKASASIALGYARIRAEVDMLREQLSAQIKIAQMNNASAEDIAKLVNDPLLALLRSGNLWPQ